MQGSVVLDLHLMKKIVEVNEEYAYAIVEPGVSFFDLYKHIQAHKMKLWMSCPALGWGSIVGNCLDRGFGYTPTGEHSQHQCGMEVVLPDGTLVRTGMGALKSQSTWPLYKGLVRHKTSIVLQLTEVTAATGPLSTVSSTNRTWVRSSLTLWAAADEFLGIVTKVGMWLFPQPDAYISCSVTVEKEYDLVALVGTLSDLQRRNIIQNSPSISNLFRQAIVSAMDVEVIQILGPHFGHKDAIPEAVLEEIRAAKGWGWWKAQFAIYGPEPIARSSWDYVKAAFAKVPGARCEGELVAGVDGQPVMASDLPEEDIPHAGVPHLKNLALMDYRGKDSGHICFSPILPPSGRELYNWYLTSKQRTADAGFDFFADFHVFPRYINAIELVVFSEDEAQRCNELYKTLAQDAVDQGYSEYRTHVAYMDLIADHFDFNDSALRRYVELLKDATDPKGVLSPGKQGIWGTSKIANMAKLRIVHTPRESDSLAEPRNGHF